MMREFFQTHLLHDKSHFVPQFEPQKEKKPIPAIGLTQTTGGPLLVRFPVVRFPLVRFFNAMY